MKRVANTLEARCLPAFGDYRRMRMPEPFRKPIDKEQEILNKAAETAARISSETANPADEDETIGKQVSP